MLNDDSPPPVAPVHRRRRQLNGAANWDEAAAFQILCVFSRVDSAAARHHHVVAVVVFFSFLSLIAMLLLLLEKRREMREKAARVDARLSLLLFNLCRRLFSAGQNHQDISRAP